MKRYAHIVLMFFAFESYAQTDLFTLPYTIVSNNATPGQTVDNGNGVVQLTQDIGEDPTNPWQASALWGTNTIDLNQPFVVETDLFFGCNSGEWGGDGMTFTLHNDPRGTASIGGGGGFLGYGGNESERIHNSIAIEFDTYDGTVWGGTDIPEDHITVLQNGWVANNHDGGSEPVDSSIWGPQAIRNSRDLEACLPNGNDYYTIRVEWTPPNTLTLYEDGTLTFSINIDLAVFGTSNVYWGFTAGSANASNEQWVAPTGSTIPWECSIGNCCVPFDFNITGNDFCQGDNTTLNVDGGYLTYSWSDGPTGQNRTINSPGTYEVTVTEDQGGRTCSSVDSITVSELELPNLSTSTIDASCNGSSNGSIDLTVTGGLSPYSYTWNTSATSEDLTGIGSGNYNVTVVDDNGCSNSTSASINEPTAINVLATSTDALCNGASDGTVTLTVSGGTPPYGFLWNNGATTQDLTAVGSGTYSVTVTDDNGCTSFASTTVNEPLALSANTTSTDATCGAANGSVTLSVNGGTTPYNFIWNNGATTQNLSAVTSGTYNVTITDDNNCSTTANATVNVPSALSASTTATDVQCNGATDGTVNLTVSGGTTPYDFLWDNGATTQNLAAVAAGTYNVTVTDDDGCAINASAIVNTPTSITTNAVATDALCNGATDGTITLTTSGGTPPYSFLWNSGATTQNLPAVGSGTYSVTVTDDHGCTAFANATVNEPSALSASTTTVDATCGQTNGSVTLSVNGGTAPYNFSWDNGATTQNLAAVAAGTYNVTITDDHNCITIASANVNVPSSLTATVTSTDALCNGASDGNVTLTVNGGTAPYNFSWNTGANTQNLTSVVAGSYNVIITDDDGCIINASTTVNEPTAITASATSTDALCNGSMDGTVTLVVSGGTEPYNLLWNNGVTTQNLIGVGAGTYTVSITDNNGCSATTSASVNEPTELSTNTVPTDELCNGSNDGAVDLTVTGGTEPCTYAWNNGNSTQDLINVGAGDYNVTVTDGHGCIAQDGATVGTPTPLSVSTLTSDVLCNEGEDGTVTVSVSGGTGNYSFNWSNGATTQNLTATGAGNYSVNITDDNGCSISASASVNEPTALTTSINAIPELCKDTEEGWVNVTVNGGTSPYNYLWSNGSESASLDSIPAGIYYVTVSDAHGCSIQDDIEIASIKCACPLTIPTAISPNSDGANDVWEIEGIDCYDIDMVRVYNRYGNLIYESTDYITPWDGNRNGEPMPVAVYYYVVEVSIEGQKPSTFTGPLTIMR